MRVNPMMMMVMRVCVCWFGIWKVSWPFFRFYCSAPLDTHLHTHTESVRTLSHCAIFIPCKLMEKGYIKTLGNFKSIIDLYAIIANTRIAFIEKIIWDILNRVLNSSYIYHKSMPTCWILQFLHHACIRVECCTDDEQDVYYDADDDDDDENDLMMKSSGMRYNDSMINGLDIWL